MLNSEKRVANQYFVSPDGKVVRYIGDEDVDEITSLHAEIASQLYPDSRDAETDLMNLGWVLVGSSVYSHPIIHKPPTQAQINTLDTLGLYKRLTILHNNYYINYDQNQNLFGSL